MVEICEPPGPYAERSGEAMKTAFGFSAAAGGPRVTGALTVLGKSAERCSQFQKVSVIFDTAFDGAIHGCAPWMSARSFSIDPFVVLGVSRPCNFDTLWPVFEISK